MSRRNRNSLLFSRLCRRAGFWSGVCALGFALVFAVSAFASQNPTQSVVGSGGTVGAQSATHRVSGTIGQIASGRSQSDTKKLNSGFWNTVGVCDCPFVGDIDGNSHIDVLDVVAMINVAFRNGEYPPGDPLCPYWTRAEVNCDGQVDVLDVVAIINTAFRNTDSRCNPCDL